MLCGSRRCCYCIFAFPHSTTMGVDSAVIVFLAGIHGCAAFNVLDKLTELKNPRVNLNRDSGKNGTRIQSISVNIYISVGGFLFRLRRSCKHSHDSW